MRASKFSAFSLLLAAIILAVHVASSSSSGVDFDGLGHQLGFIPVKSECRGSIAECMSVEGDDGDQELDLEFAMDGEINRRILAMRRNSVPCSRRGASYYNCRAGGQANPYSRGCSAITRCRR
ncbi:hypothetical protein CISIN_1g032876mg [Citrus sinensis]|uniref:Rapid alkalinization factor 1 n=1 Tax=Citrus sinensis TaxID=2711 RepID=A0A067FWB4_CITSI|nr:hypothetical protein CISIN_1g032876mg [Citrus sinensis]